MYMAFFLLCLFCSAKGETQTLHTIGKYFATEAHTSPNFQRDMIQKPIQTKDVFFQIIIECFPH